MLVSNIDLLIICTYLIGMVILGGILGRENKDSKDYFLAGRSMPWFPIALSVAATMISCNGFIGAPGWAYNSGMMVMMQNITVPFALFISATFFVPLFYSLKVTSIYEVIELRLGEKSRLVAVITYLLNSLIQLSSMVFVPSLILNRLTGIHMYIIVPCIVLLAITYTLLGGIKAVIWTDVIQIILMWGSLILAVIYLFSSTGLSFGDTIASAREAGKLVAFELDWKKSLSDPSAMWVALIGGFVVWGRYFSFDQTQVQRVITAKSIKDIKRSFVFSGVVMNMLYFFFVVLGVILFVAYGGKSFETDNDIMIHFISTLPVGLVGILLSGLFAAAMSSIDSLLNSMSAVFSKDIYERYVSKGKALSLKQSMLVVCGFGVAICFLSVIAFSNSTSSVLAVVGQYIGYISGPSCGIFLLALCTKKANDKGTAIGAALGFIITVIFGRFSHVTWMWNSVVGVTATVAIGYLMSVLTKEKNTEKALEYTVMGFRKKYVQNTDIDKKTDASLRMDKYSYILLGFFLLQFVILFVLQV